MDKPKFLLPLAAVLGLGLNSCATLGANVAENSTIARQEILKALNATNTGIQPDGHSVIECSGLSDIVNSEKQAGDLARDTLPGANPARVESKQIKNGRYLTCVLATRD